MSARKLARPAPGELARQLHQIEQLHDPFLDLVLVRLHRELADDTGQLGPHRVARIEGVEGVLEDHLHGANHLGRALLHREARHILAVKDDLTLGRRLQAHHDLGEGRLAATRFADDGHRLGFTSPEGDALVRFDVPDALSLYDRAQGVVGQLVVLLHVVDVEDLVTDLRRLAGKTDRLVAGPIDVPPAATAHGMPVLVRHFRHLQAGSVAHTFFEEVAAWTEEASLRPLVRQGQLSADRHQGMGMLIRAGQRDAAEQTLGVGVTHVIEDLVDRSALHHHARIHDVDPVAGLEDQPQIMGDVDHRGVEAAGDLADQLDDASLNGHVQRRRRLVEQEQGRPRQERHGDDHALLLSARDLMRIGVHHAFRIRQLHVRQHLRGALPSFLLGHVLMVERHLHELATQQH